MKLLYWVHIERPHRLVHMHMEGTLTEVYLARCRSRVRAVRTRRRKRARETTDLKGQAQYSITVTQVSQGRRARDRESVRAREREEGSASAVRLKERARARRPSRAYTAPLSGSRGRCAQQEAHSGVWDRARRKGAQGRGSRVPGGELRGRRWRAAGRVCDAKRRVPVTAHERGAVHALMQG